MMILKDWVSKVPDLVGVFPVKVWLVPVAPSAKWVIHVGMVGEPSVQVTELPAVITLENAWPIGWGLEEEISAAVLNDGSAEKLTVVVTFNPVVFVTLKL